MGFLGVFRFQASDSMKIGFYRISESRLRFFTFRSLAYRTSESRLGVLKCGLLIQGYIVSNICNPAARIVISRLHRSDLHLMSKL